MRTAEEVENKIQEIVQHIELTKIEISDCENELETLEERLEEEEEELETLESELEEIEEFESEHTKYQVTNIEWDFDEDVSLPTEMEIFVPNDIEKEEIDDFISDTISDMTGFCHKGFSLNID